MTFATSSFAVSNTQIYLQTIPIKNRSRMFKNSLNAYTKKHFIVSILFLLFTIFALVHAEMPSFSSAKENKAPGQATIIDKNATNKMLEASNIESVKSYGIKKHV